MDAEKAFEEAEQISDPAYTIHAINEAMSRLNKLVKLPNIKNRAQELIDYIEETEFNRDQESGPH